ncbi:flagellar motor switch protein FliM [Nesterenkonia sp. NBAIMH1]|uniref:flagellar motor switch protein FliM n=1 Tax=Nesterenkonia sp. NBAIMH1 TaxID=2600320 RepID=UPI001FEF838C|nr:flagellar motor switch protein FliM [Nesterenkonia sp. NBAIMH1]
MNSPLSEKTGAVRSPEEVQAGRPPALYDFRRPTTLTREHSRTLELAFETFARQWGTQLTARVRVLSSVTHHGVEMKTYDDYVASLPPTTAMVLCGVERSDASAVVQFPAAGALNWVSHILGSPRAYRAEERKFTRIEHTLISTLVSETLEDLHYSLGGLLQGQITVETVHYNAQFAQAAAKSELMVTAGFTVQVGDQSVQASLALPAEAVLPQLCDESEVEPEEQVRGRMGGHLVHVPMDLALALTETPVTSEQILNLVEGDVLRLTHAAHRPLHLTADGQRVGTAAAGKQSGRIAAVVASREES